MDYIKVIGANLKAARKEKKIGQKDVAKYLNSKISTISAWECGTNRMSADDFIRYCDYLGVSLDTMAGHIPQGITPSEMDMINKFRSIPQDVQNVILASLETAYNNSKKGNAAVSA